MTRSFRLIFACILITRAHSTSDSTGISKSIRVFLRLANSIKNKVIDKYINDKSIDELELWLRDRRIMTNLIPRILLFKMKKANADNLTIHISRKTIVELQKALKSTSIDIIQIIIDRIKPNGITEIDTFIPNIIDNAIAIDTLVLDYMADLIKELLKLIPKSLMKAIRTALSEIIDEQKDDLVLKLSHHGVMQLRISLLDRKTVTYLVNFLREMIHYLRKTKLHSDQYIKLVLNNKPIIIDKNLRKAINNLKQLVDNDEMLKISDQIKLPILIWLKKRINKLFLVYIQNNLENTFNEKMTSFGLFLLPNNLNRLSPYIQNSSNLFDIYTKLFPHVSFLTGTPAFQWIATMIGKKDLAQINSNLKQIDKDFKTIITMSIEMLNSKTSPLKYITEDDVAHLKRTVSSQEGMRELQKCIINNIDKLIQMKSKKVLSLLMN